MLYIWVWTSVLKEPHLSADARNKLNRAKQSVDRMSGPYSYTCLQALQTRLLPLWSRSVRSAGGLT